MTWIQTRSGVAFPLLDPSPRDVRLHDIAHALSHLCRFTGHIHTFYSVAEHSVRVAEILPPHLKPYGLLHDAHEAYVGDIATPIQHAMGPDFRAALKKIKHRLDVAIHARFGLPFPLSADDAAALKVADVVMMMTEKRDLLGASAQSWGTYESSVVLPARIVPWSTGVAFHVFAGRLEDVAVGGAINT